MIQITGDFSCYSPLFDSEQRLLLQVRLNEERKMIYNYFVRKNRDSARWNLTFLQKVLKVVEIVAHGGSDGITVQEISDRAGMPMSSSHRILNDLVECDVLAKDTELRRYRFSPRIIPLVNEISRKMNLGSLTETLVELKNLVNETIFLSELTENGVTSVLTVESDRVFSFRARSGVYLPVYCTAAGLAIAANIGREEALRLICNSYENGSSELKRCPLEDFEARLEKVKRDGFAFCDEEYEPGIRALAVPVFNGKGKVIASITAIAPKERLNNMKMNEEIVDHLKKAAVMISKFTY